MHATQELVGFLALPSCFVSLRPAYVFMSTSFVLYSRSYCHLCDDMRLALEQCAGVLRFTVDVFDVDNDPALLARYDELVPVLMGRQADGSLKELCHYFLEPDVVRNFFQISAASPLEA